MATGATFQNIFFPFDPKSINGCNLWLDAADPNGTGILPANGATLTTWKDKSVSNFPFTSVGSAYSTSAVNGRPGINIGTNFFGYDPGSAQNNWQEVFALGVWTGGSTFNSYNGFVTSSVNSDGGAQGGILFIGNAGSSNWWGPGNTYVQQFINGTQTGVALPAILNPFIARTHSATTINLQGLRFGIDRSFTDRKWIGFISEVISYNTPLTVLQRQQVEGYLAWKWGTQGVLVASNPYKTGAPQALPTINSAQVGTIPLTIQKNRNFTPTQISGCSLWLDGADPAGNGVIPANGTSITSWVDKSLSGNTCSNASSINSPVLYSSILNGKPVLSFTGPAVLNTTTSQWLDNTVMTFPNTKNTIFALVYNDNSTSKSFTANNYIISGRADALISYSSYSGNNFATFIGSGSGWNDLNTNTPSQNMNGVWAITGMTLNTNVLTPYYNGTALNTKSGTMGSTTGFIIGDAPSGYRGQCWNGYMAEIIMFPTVLGNTQRQQVEGYLAWKWGLQGNLPAGHLYKNINNNYNPFPSTTPALTRSISSIFKPTNYAGCQLWLDAWDPLGNGSRQKSPLTLTSWVDKSTSARHATMFNGSSIAYSPTAFNNRPALLFTQTQNMSSAAAAGTFPTAITFFMVYQRTGGGTYDTLVTRGVGNLAAPIDFYTNISTGNFSRNIGNGTAQADYNTTSGSNFTNVTTPSLYYANATAASGLLDAFNFATPTDPSSGILTGVYYGDTGTAIYIGTRADSVTKLTASVAEVIVYSTTPSDPQRQNIEGYLAWKWGLQLPASHPYKNYPPPPQ